MKTRFTLFLLAAGLVVSACSKKAVHFPLGYTTQTTVPATAGPDAFSLYTTFAPTFSDSELKKKHSRTNKITSAVTDQLRLIITAPAGTTFGFAQTIDVYINAEGLPETHIATLDSIPAETGDTLQLNTLNKDVREYIKAEKFRLRMYLVTDQPVPEDVHVSLFSNFYIDAQQTHSKK